MGSTFSHAEENPDIKVAESYISQGKYDKAETLLSSVLLEHKDNIKAQKLLISLDKKRNKVKAARMLEEADIAIEKGNLISAFDLLANVIIIDPGNENARRKHLAIHEIMEAERNAAGINPNRNLATMEFLDEGQELIGRKVRVLMSNGFTIVGVIVKNTPKAITIYSKTTRREYDIPKVEIVMKTRAKRLK